MQDRFGDVMVSTGILKQDKRAEDCSVFVKMGTLIINGKTNKLAFAA